MTASFDPYVSLHYNAVCPRCHVYQTVSGVKDTTEVKCSACHYVGLKELTDRKTCKNCQRALCVDIDCGSPKKGGLRYNGNKLRMSLISPVAAKGLAAVLTYGEKKYAAWNWAKGLPYSETIDALERHLAEFKMGNEIDQESGLPHIDHIAANVMFLSHFQKCDTNNDGGFDDRYKAMAKCGE